MENKGKQVGGSSSSSSFTVDLFGPKDPTKSSSSASVFGSVFGPSSTGLVKDTTYPGRNHDYGSQYGNVKHGSSEYQNQKGLGDSKSVYQNETAVNNPCNFSSSIYYGGQEVYSPAGQTTNPQQNFRKDGNDEDPNDNSSSASRGNWWQGSLYY